MIPEASASAIDQEPLRAKILVVDDDERNAFAIATVLEELGQTLVVAHSGEEALKHLLHEDFAVILLDLHMPGMDGYETASLIRGRQRSRHIPIVFLTAVFRDESHLLQAYSAGAVDMVFKPVDPFILKSKVSVFVDLYLRRLEVRREAELRHRLQEENFRVRTEKLLAEEALRRSEENYRLIVESVSDYAIFMLDPQGRIVSWNPGAARIKQYSAEEIIGQHISIFYTPEDRENGVPQRALSAAEQGKYAIEGWRVRKNGSLFWASVVIDPIRGDQGELIGFAKITRDITEQRQLQQQLIQAQKMETVGQLTGGIAHDFNNLLTVILGNLDLVAKHVGGNERLQRYFSAIRHASERGHALTRQLLAFSRRQHLAPEVLDVCGLLRAFEPLIRRAVGESVNLEMLLPDAEVPCEVDPSQLENAILNLAMNARDAMPGGGRIEIAVRRAEHAPERSAENADGAVGPWVVITVADRGTGMSPAVRARAFEPFFTTKETGRGTGLGLSQVYGFVRQSGGFVTLDTELDQGTEISIYLQACSKPIARPSAAPDVRREPAPGLSEHVLLVEDDPSVLALGIEMLTDLGYRVKTASDGAGALEILRRGDPVDLLFTDVVMPGGYTGVQLASEARRLRPGIPVLLTSGYTGEALARHQAGRADLPLIEKPYRKPDLAEKLRDVLRHQPLPQERRSRGSQAAELKSPAA